jgi:hypothetical protein
MSRACAVVEIICEIEARRYFSKDVDIRAITAFVFEISYLSVESGGCPNGARS